MKYLVILITLLFSLETYSQIVDNPPFRLLREFPQFENHGMGIGNLGFDSPLNIYNPHYISRDSSNIKLFIGSDFGLSGTHYTYLYFNSIEDNLYLNPKTIIPSFVLQYWFKDYLFQCGYYQDYSLADHDKTYTTTYDLVNNYIVGSGEREINIRDNILQFNVSHSPTPELSYTLGILTRSFKYEGDIKTIPSIVNQDNLLDNFQFLAGITVKPFKYLQAYLTFVSQRPRVNLSETVYRLNNLILVSPYLPKVSYYGIIGYGIQANIIDPLKVSLEMRHQFLEDTTIAFHSDGFTSLEKVHIWNNEITLGATLSLLDRFKLGYRYSYFIKYNNYKGMPAQGYITNPFSFTFSASVNIDRFTLLAMYQHSSAYYYLPDSWDAVHAYEDKTYLFSLSLGYSFSLPGI